MISFFAFGEELEKLAGFGEHALELTGLGILAAPYAKNAITGKKTSSKTERNSELAGLGVLAAHPAYSALSTGKHLLMKHGGAFDKATQMADAGRVLAHSSVLPKPKFTMDSLRSAYKTQGLKPALSSIARHVA